MAGFEQLLSYSLWHNQLVVMGLLFIATILLLFVFHLTYRWLIRQAEKTATAIDDILVRASYMPVILLILALGLSAILARLVAFLPWLGILRVDSYFPFIIAFCFFWFCLRCASYLQDWLMTHGKTLLEEAKTDGKEAGDKKAATRLPLLIWLLKKAALDPATVHSIVNLIRACIIIVFLLTFLSMSGVSITGILAFGGVGGIILGFAIKDTLANFFSGLLIFWERPFVVGEWVRCNPVGIEGVVEKIGWRITQIRTFDDRPMFIPNSIFVSNYIETPQRMTKRRIREHIGIRYDDMAKLRDILADIQQMLLDHEHIKKPSRTYKGPLVSFSSYGEHALVLMIDAMTDSTGWHDYNRTKEDILFKIAEIIQKHQAKFAFPTQTLYIQQQSSHDNNSTD